MKESLRKQAQAARNILGPKERREKSREIGNRLFGLPEFRTSSRIAFFASFGSEVETAPMIRLALAEGKHVVLPRVTGQALLFFEIHDFDRDVAPGTWGIPEPVGIDPVDLDSIDLMIVPGLAFDLSGNRLGYGAGYYDRVLGLFKGMSMGLAFEVQIMANIPVAVYDVPIKKIVTDKRVIGIR
ncbi:MAG: 5-formyltetrahydrofolate cyclo-ligase [Nitrospirota bacterium]